VRKRPYRTRDLSARDTQEKRSSWCAKHVLQNYVRYPVAPPIFQHARSRNMNARVSTEDQNPDLQRDALTAAGCEPAFEDKASGVRNDRPGLAETLSHLRRGDCLVIWRLDRLGRRITPLLSEEAGGRSQDDDGRDHRGLRVKDDGDLV